jgi:hypothetical protein
MLPEEYIIGKVKFHEESGTFFDEKNHHIADIRGWGHIQYLFKNPDGTEDLPQAAVFQDALGHFIAEAINEKLKRV